MAWVLVDHTRRGHVITLRHLSSNVKWAEWTIIPPPLLAVARVPVVTRAARTAS